MLAAVRKRGREPSHRRYGLIYRPSGRAGFTQMDWVNDGGHDAPPNNHDLIVILLWVGGLLLLAAGVGALLFVVGVQL